ncbi:MAG: hypothetical protein JJU34_06015 [Lunatimonas sp.]|uniref:hypothetical protein n=1 Tax=Lunatimonas sp. TaxID=2060141 RepID=UPI00263AB4C8|nr:hypothetical protein [Lunatimonas sp.]MCC5936817.1 hypothetical protein [Lunatimonas sp.]
MPNSFLTYLLCLLATLLPIAGFTQSSPTFHLTANPWEPQEISQAQLLEVIEATCAVAATFQNDLGAIVDPFLGREHQYATPYFAYAVGTLLKAGAGESLKEAGLLAMEHSLKCLAQGSKSIPDEHGEFFISPLAKALALYQPHVDKERYAKWIEQVKTPLSKIMQNQEGRINNWRTYAMKGEWDRVKLGLADREEAVTFIEKAWLVQTQRARILQDRHFLYQDWSSDPQSLAVEAVGRGNLLGLVLEGYDGPSAEEMASAIFAGTHTTLFLQAADGQAPTNGRTDNHVFNDVLYFLGFEAMASASQANGQTALAGQYKRAASLAFISLLRWQRTDAPWKGSFYITKNFFDPADRIGYQPASQWGNYTGAIVYHLAEAWHIRNQTVAEQPAPTEIGGYVLETDPKFGTLVANAGGLQVVANLRGASIPKYNQSWTPLGVTRITKSGWDGRLGPSDGVQDLEAGTPFLLKTATGEILDSYRYQSGVTLGPEWMERDHWVRISDLPANYQAIPEVHFVHPLLVRFSLHYTYVTGRGGPYFTQEFVVTPDAVVTRLNALQAVPFGLTVPLLENDGRSLDVQVSDQLAKTQFSGSRDSQHFIALNRDSHFDGSSLSLKSSYGWLKPLRLESTSGSVDLLIYPQKPNEPDASAVAQSFRWTSEGFESLLGTVAGNTYIGSHAAGGEGRTLDLNGNGIFDVIFDLDCQFVVQHRSGRITAIESDRPVGAIVQGRHYSLSAYKPVWLE